jgi:cytochrome c peroxidase
MNCHSEMWSSASLLEPVRESFRSGRSIEWVRINDLPDFVYFQHDIHINKGVGCTTCHGPIGRMPITYQAAPLTMEWCLDCHRAPEKYLRLREQVFNPDYGPDDVVAAATSLHIMPPTQIALGKRLIAEYHVRSPHDITSCSTCHR